MLALLLTFVVFSQTTDTTYIYGDSLNSHSIQIYKNWDYHPGDDSAWALTKFSSAGWKTVDCRMYLDSIKSYNLNGIGWFRKTIIIDSSLMNKTIAMTLNHFGASELYINGKLINKFGAVSPKNKDEEDYYSNSEPIAINFDTGRTYLLSVRYSNHLPADNTYMYERFSSAAGFYPTLKNLSVANKYYGITRVNTIGKYAFLCGIFLSIFVVYVLLFLFYSSKREYLYYALFTFSFSYIFAGKVLWNTLHSGIFYLYVDSIINRLFQMAIFISVLAFLYQIFYGRLLKIFRYILLIGITAYILQFIQSVAPSTTYMFLAVVVFTSFEILRVTFLAIKHKKKNAWVIGAGLCGFAGLIILIFIFNMFGARFGFASSYGIALLLTIPLSMSIYIARTSSQTNENLEIQLANVKKLSEEAIEQEKISAKITAENERKTRELEEARRLQLSMLPESVPKLPHLDIAVYMQTATEVGGDYYDFAAGLDGTLNIALGDATGHGMQAGTLVTIMKGIFTLEAGKSDVIPFFNKSVEAIKEIKLGRLMMAFVFLKIKDSILSLSNAGVPPVYIYRKDKNEVEEIDNKGMPLGAINNFPYKETKTELKSGDVIFLLSDGFPELSNNEMEIYGYERVRKIFKEVAEYSADEIIEKLKNAVENWSGGKVPEDDVTFVVIKIK